MTRGKLWEILVNNMVGLGLQLLLGVVLAAILTFYINSKITEAQNKFNQSLQERHKMEDSAHQITSLMYGRLWRMNRLLYHYQNPTHPEDRGKLRSEYTDAIDRWSSSIGNLEREVSLRFGEANLQVFKNDIHKPFLDIHERFRKLIEKSKQSLSPTQLGTELEALRPDIITLTTAIENFNRSMEMALVEKFERDIPCK